MELFSIFNTREIAIGIWSFILAVWLFLKSNVARSILNCLKSSLGILPYLTPMLIYIGISVFILERIGFWDVDLLKITIYWIFGWSFVLFLNANKVRTEKGFLKKQIIGLLQLTAIVAFVVNFYTFPLWLELILVPFVTIIFTIGEFSKTIEPKVYKVLNGASIYIGSILLLVDFYLTVANFKVFASVETLREFILPIVLSVMLLPFIYSLSWYAHYEQRVRTERQLTKNLAVKQNFSEKI